MSTTSARASMPQEGSIAGDLARGILGFLWHAIRLAILFCLLILEPFVRLVLSGAALLGVLTALIYKGSSVPHDRFWFLIWMSLGCVVALVIYYGLIRLLSAACAAEDLLPAQQRARQQPVRRRLVEPGAAAPPLLWTRSSTIR